MSIKSRTLQWSKMAVCAGALVAGEAASAPILQLYIEDATYDKGWYTPTTSFRLWAIGDLSGVSAINNVTLVAVYDDTGEDVTITVTPTQIGGTGQYGGFTDLSTPSAVSFIQMGTEGSTPLMDGDHRKLPNHGEYGKGRVWQEFALGAFTSADSQLGNFVDDFPIPGATSAQINAYDVVVTGAFAHFDLYGEYEAHGNTFYAFAPPGHDATDGPALPAPATLALLGIGAVGLLFRRRGQLLQSNVSPA